jgi:hypothetical protein
MPTAWSMRVLARNRTQTWVALVFVSAYSWAQRKPEHDAVAEYSAWILRIKGAIMKVCNHVRIDEVQPAWHTDLARLAIAHVH